MAQGRVVQGHLASEAVLGLAESQSCEIQQYERIIRFQEAVLSGNHPTIKLPPHLIASTQSSIHTLDATANSGAVGHQLGNSQSHSTSARHSAVAVVTGKTSTAKPFNTGNTEINPILLEKSDDLIKAEIQLQRQKLERALREEVEQRRAATKNAAQAEHVVDLDLSVILSKALTLVQATAAPSPVDENVGATNHETSSDSFDDNTFYSSQHNTPESVLASRVRNESEDEGTSKTQESLQQSLQAQPSRHDQTIATAPDLNASRPYQLYPGAAPGYPVNSRSRVGQVPGIGSHIGGGVLSSGPSQNTSAGQSQSDDSGNIEVDQQEVTYPRQHLSDAYIDHHPPSPLMRTHEPPHSHQSRQISPFIAARRPAPGVEQVSHSSTGTPAQVVALRNEPTAATSPESSPQGGKQTEKRKGKKKKRKADRQAPEAEATPYIKPEPRSTSPMNALSYIRPSKRQRFAQRQANEPGYEDVRYDPQNSSAPHELFAGQIQRDARIPIGYERADIRRQRAASATVGAAVSGGHVYGREYAEERYVSGGPYVMAQPPSHHDPHPGPISTQVRPTEEYPRPSWSYQRSYEPHPMSIRSEGEPIIASARPPPTRIIVDAFGREYIEPPRPTVVRHSVAPPVRAGEPEIIYERAAPRSVSRHAGADAYEQGGAIYRRSPSSFMPRRVVTQPEYVSQNYRETHQREYSSRPMAPSNEFVEVMAPPERRHVEEGPREYISRSASVRPAEPVRYEYGRIQSVRPEPPAHQYATSVHPESRREAAQPYIRDYGSRPVDGAVMRREYSVRPPVERYYDQPVRGGEEIAFIERPGGATQEIVYADDARREVYR